MDVYNLLSIIISNIKTWFQSILKFSVGERRYNYLSLFPRDTATLEMCAHHPHHTTRQSAFLGLALFVRQGPLLKAAFRFMTSCLSFLSNGVVGSPTQPALLRIQLRVFRTKFLPTSSAGKQ